MELWVIGSWPRAFVVSSFFVVMVRLIKCIYVGCFRRNDTDGVCEEKGEEVSEVVDGDIVVDDDTITANR